MSMIRRPDLSGFLEEIDNIDTNFRSRIEADDDSVDKHKVMSDWMEARHDAEKRMMELIDIRV